ncbi:MAG: DUF493 domain-containing protein [Legionellales bacterium]|nr:DUF493 domain-containing protein [Legionellales bacterium]
MSDLELMQFPCDYLLKVIGYDRQGFLESVITIVELHVENLDRTQVRHRPSQNGNYAAISIQLQAQSKTQMDALYLDLNAHENVVMVL